MPEIKQKTYGLTIMEMYKCHVQQFRQTAKRPQRHDLTFKTRLLITNTMLICNLATKLPQKKKTRDEATYKTKKKNPND
jgi:hypothetical protein